MHFLTVALQILLLSDGMPVMPSPVSPTPGIFLVPWRPAQLQHATPWIRLHDKSILPHLINAGRDRVVQASNDADIVDK